MQEFASVEKAEYFVSRWFLNDIIIFPVCKGIVGNTMVMYRNRKYTKTSTSQPTLLAFILYTGPSVFTNNYHFPTTNTNIKTIICTTLSMPQTNTLLSWGKREPGFEASLI